MKKILIVRSDRIGDVVLTTPIIKIIRDHYPQSHIAFLTGPKTIDLVEGNPYLNEVIIYDKYRLHKDFFKTILFSFALKKKKFDVALIFNPSKRAHWICWLANIPVRIGYSRKSGFLLTHRFKDKKGEGLQSESFYNEELLSVLGIPMRYSTELFVPDLDFRQNGSCRRNTPLFSQAAKSGVPVSAPPILSKFKDETFLVINPSASCPSKKWPAQNFALLCNLIFEKLNLHIVLIGNDEDCKKVQDLSRAPLNVLSENLKLNELASLFKKTCLHISGDTGPMHIASAVGTPVISIFGRNLPGLGPKRWAPLKGNNSYVQKNIGCNPCLAHDCHLDFDCLKTIKVEDIFKSVRNYVE